jgi:hypothetical protein
MSNSIHGFNPFRIVATVPRSTVLPHGGTVVSYEVDKTTLSFETIDMFRNAGYQERTNSRTYPHSVLVLFDEDRDPRPLHALNALNCAAPSVAARLIALHESGGKLTLWLERFALGDLDHAKCAASCAAIRDSWQVELHEMELLDAPEFSARCVELDELSEECAPLDALDRAVIEINKIYPLGWASRAARQGVRS